MPFGVSKGQRALLFLSWLFFFMKKFQSHCKDASIFHIKCGNNNKLSISQLVPL
jgi:hypothetical protein